MRFYNRRGELDLRPLDRTYGAEAEMALSALDCVLNGRKAAYGSSELTTGQRFWSLAREHRVSSTLELREALGEAGFQNQLWHPNVEAADDFARALERRLGRLVVTPAPFEAPDWSQPEYLAFWESLIRTRIDAAYFNRGWAFSNGCTFELAVSADAGLPIFDHHGQPLDLASAVAQVRAAIAEIEAAGLEPGPLRENLARIEMLAARPAAATIKTGGGQRVASEGRGG